MPLPRLCSCAGADPRTVPSSDFDTARRVCLLPRTFGEREVRCGAGPAPARVAEETGVLACSPAPAPTRPAEWPVCWPVAPLSPWSCCWLLPWFGDALECVFAGCQTPRPLNPSKGHARAHSLHPLPLPHPPPHPHPNPHRNPPPPPPPPPTHPQAAATGLRGVMDTVWGTGDSVRHLDLLLDLCRVVEPLVDDPAGPGGADVSDKVCICARSVQERCTNGVDATMPPL
jgi:hypothetical protein